MSGFRETVQFACTKDFKATLDEAAKKRRIPRAVLLREIVVAYFEGRDLRDADVLRAEHEQVVSNGGIKGALAAHTKSQQARADQVRQSKDHPWRKNSRILGKAARNGGV